MSRLNLSLLALVIALVAVVSSFRPSKSPIIVDDSIQLGQDLAEVQGRLRMMGYEIMPRSDELEPNEIRYQGQVASKHDIPAFMRLAVKRGRVMKISGRAHQIGFNKNEIVFGETSLADAKRLLGPPSWEKYVGDATGVCYRKLNLYLTAVDGTISGFSLGDLPKEPD